MHFNVIWALGLTKWSSLQIQEESVQNKEELGWGRNAVTRVARWLVVDHIEGEEILRMRSIIRSFVLKWKSLFLNDECMCAFLDLSAAFTWIIVSAVIFKLVQAVKPAVAALVCCVRFVPLAWGQSSDVQTAARSADDTLHEARCCCVHFRWQFVDILRSFHYYFLVWIIIILQDTRPLTVF